MGVTDFLYGDFGAGILETIGCVVIGVYTASKSSPYIFYLLCTFPSE